MNGPASLLPPEVAAIMAQINALPAEMRSAALNALGREVVVAADETRQELRGKAAEAYRQAVKIVSGNIPNEMNVSHGTWKVLREGTQDLRSYMVNSMGFDARAVTEDEVRRFAQVADNYRTQLACVEQDPDSIDYAILTVEEIVTLLAADSPVLKEKGAQLKIAKLAKEKLLSYPQATEGSNETCERFRTHYTYAEAVQEIVVCAPLESDQEGIELLKRIQPHGYLAASGVRCVEQDFKPINLSFADMAGEGRWHKNMDGACRVVDVVKTGAMSFAQMVGEALKAAPRWALQILVDKLYDSCKSYETQEQRMYLLAKAVAPVEGLEFRMREAFEQLSFPQEVQPLFDYYLQSFRAIRLLERHATQRPLPWSLCHASRDYRIWARDVQGVDIDRRVLIGALVWEDLLTLFETEQGELKDVIKHEIFRQLAGEPKSVAFYQLDAISDTRLGLLKTLLSDQNDLREKLREKSYGTASDQLSKERKEMLCRQLGLY